MHSPAEISEKSFMERRDLKFGRDCTNPRWWHSGDARVTSFFNALSATFPLGERFFVDAVRRYRDEAPEPLRAQISDFMFQEATHSREHVAFNQQAESSGYDMAKLESRTRFLIGWARTRKPIIQLATTCALEHFTATLANAALADPTFLDGAAPEARRLWRWHAVEEIEHKAVAFDTFLYATRKMTSVGRWALRCFVMAAALIRFHGIICSNMADLLKQDGKNDGGNWVWLLGYLYGKPGPLRRLITGAFGYCRPGFHPWDQDDRALLASVALEFPATDYANSSTSEARVQA